MTTQGHQVRAPLLTASNVKHISYLTTKTGGQSCPGMFVLPSNSTVLSGNSLWYFKITKQFRKLTASLNESGHHHGLVMESRRTSSCTLSKSLHHHYDHQMTDPRVKTRPLTSVQALTSVEEIWSSVSQRFLSSPSAHCFSTYPSFSLTWWTVSESPVFLPMLSLILIAGLPDAEESLMTMFSGVDF